jgi:AraC family transcriptional regulator of adaptative response/methylated-DNA-[protein]-cysteine methyltransferase
MEAKNMEDQNDINFNRITRAIEFINAHFREQPDLDEIAAEVNLSPFHFQRMFIEWAGISPKKFLQYITVEYAKKMLKEQKETLFNTAIETGLSGTGRLHDLFIQIEGMTPGEYKNGGEDLMIRYSFAESLFGDILVASTPKGICHLAFADDKVLALDSLKKKFPGAHFGQQAESMHQQALSFFSGNMKQVLPVKLHVKGTGFQIKVWETLLKIPMGRLSTYGEIAAGIHQPNASRAVGSAIGDNPVAFLIPCHRVIRSSGIIGQYHWGSARKTAMIGWEVAQCHKL